MTFGPDIGGDRFAPVAPAYGPASLSAVLPGAARALGVETGLPAVPVPSSRSICVVLLDGLGAHALRDAQSTAPFLHGLLTERGPEGVVSVGCPSTTATSLATFGTGLPPGRHGLVGYSVLDPDRGELLNELSWDPAVDPLRWQPHPTIFERLTAAGVPVTATGNPEFEGSGLTAAALRGGAFVGRKRLAQRVDLALQLLRAADRCLIYLYWGAIDGAGHVHGLDSRPWHRQLRSADREMARLARRLPTGSAVVITADHGMVDSPAADRVDLADRADLASSIQILGGEPRLAQAYCAPGTAAGVAHRLAGELGDRAWVRTRDAAIDAGWFGPVVEDRVRPRIGDVLVAARGTFALVDSRSWSPRVLDLIGQHGSLTAAEMEVPLLVVAG